METKEIKQNNTHSTERVDFLVQTAKNEAKIKPERSLNILKEAINISNSIDYRIGYANAKFNEGICQRQLSNFSDAIKCYSEALAEYKDLNDLSGECAATNKNKCTERDHDFFYVSVHH